MSDIRYVCLSDLHLGEEDSLLTKLKADGSDIDPLSPGPIMERLVECLQYLIERHNKGKKPDLILNGDVLELALCTTSEAAMVFERFIELVMRQGSELFEEIIYIPGNHDHHLWESARETQYVRYMNRKYKPGDQFEVPWHVTNLFPGNQKEPISSYFLSNLIQRYEHLKDKQIKVFYPCLGLKSPDDKKCVIVTHGHYTEPIYQLMSTLKEILFPRQKRALNIGEIEAENFAWIDFFWSTMGRSGQVGRDVEVIYEKMQYVKGLQSIIDDLADSLAERFDLPGWGDWMEARIMRTILGKFMDSLSKRERTVTKNVLTFEADDSLTKFVTGPLCRLILDENEGIMPEEVTIVFGHTHKPFQKDMHFEGYPPWVNVYNSGGWVVETTKPAPAHGAAVVLVDEELNVTSLRMYNEAQDPKHYVVRVAEARHADEKSNPFHTDIQNIIDPGQDPWKSFSETVAKEILNRAENLERRIKKFDYID